MFDPTAPVRQAGFDLFHVHAHPRGNACNVVPLPPYLARPTQLCQLAGEFRGEVPPGGLLAESKIDGWRCLRFAGVDGRTRMWSRQGMPLDGVAHIDRYLARLEAAAGLPLMFDGELQVEGSLAATKAWCERGWRIGGDRGHLYLFDCLTLAEWRAGGSDRPLYQRKARLVELVAQVGAEGLPWMWREGSKGADGGPAPVTVLPDVWLFDAADVLAEARRVWAAGGEGLMLKAAESPYRRRRSNDWLKVKSASQFRRAA